MHCCIVMYATSCRRGYRGSSPTAVQCGDRALCGSHPVVTSRYYCRLGDFLHFLYACVFITFFMFSVCLFLCSFSTLILLVGSFDL